MVGAHLRLVADSEPLPLPAPYEDIEDRATAGQARARSPGSEFKHLAREFLERAGASFHGNGDLYGSYVPLDTVCGSNGKMILVLADGVLDDSSQAGLRRTDTVKKAGFDAVQLKRSTGLPILLVTSHLPDVGAARSQLADCSPDFLDVIATSNDPGGRVASTVTSTSDRSPVPSRLRGGPRPAPGSVEPVRRLRRR